MVIGDAVVVATKIVPGVKTGFAGGNKTGAVCDSEGTSNISHELSVAAPLVQLKVAAVCVIAATTKFVGLMQVAKVVKLFGTDQFDGTGEQTTLT